MIRNISIALVALLCFVSCAKVDPDTYLIEVSGNDASNMDLFINFNGHLDERTVNQDETSLSYEFPSREGFKLIINAKNRNDQDDVLTIIVNKNGQEISNDVLDVPANGSKAWDTTLDRS